MHRYRVSVAAELLGVSSDTLRRWIDAGRLGATTDPSGLLRVDGLDLAGLAAALAGEQAHSDCSSERNRFPGIVTRVLRGDVMSQVEIHSGRRRVVSLISTEAVDALRIEPGAPATASIKSTSVTIST